MIQAFTTFNHEIKHYKCHLMSLNVGFLSQLNSNVLPSGKQTNIAIENGPVEIVDLPIQNAWWIFQ